MASNIITNKGTNDYNPPITNDDIELQQLDMTASQGITNVSYKPQMTNDEIELWVS